MTRTKNITLNSTPVLLGFDDDADGPTAIAVQNTSESATLYIGGDSVSVSNFGIKLLPGQTFSADLPPYERLYAVGSSTASILVVNK